MEKKRETKRALVGSGAVNEEKKGKKNFVHLVLGYPGGGERRKRGMKDRDSYTKYLNHKKRWCGHVRGGAVVRQLHGKKEREKEKSRTFLLSQRRRDQKPREKKSRGIDQIQHLLRGREYGAPSTAATTGTREKEGEIRGLQ